MSMFWRRLLLTGALGGGASFSPSDVAGLVAWYDFSDISTLYQDSAKTTAVTADGDVIGAAVDKSGNGNDMLQGTTAQKPIYKTGIQNSLSIARFDGVAMNMSAGDVISGPSTLSVFAVFTADAVPASFYPIITKGLGAPGNREYALYVAKVGASAYVQFYAVDESLADIDYAQTAAITPGTFYYSEGEYADTGDVLSAYLNGTETAVGTPVIIENLSAELRMGASENVHKLDGDIAEILIYSSAVSDADRALINTYLSDRWGI